MPIFRIFNTESANSWRQLSSWDSVTSKHIQSHSFSK